MLSIFFFLLINLRYTFKTKLCQFPTFLILSHYRSIISSSSHQIETVDPQFFSILSSFFDSIIISGFKNLSFSIMSYLKYHYTRMISPMFSCWPGRQQHLAVFFFFFVEWFSLRIFLQKNSINYLYFKPIWIFKKVCYHKFLEKSFLLILSVLTKCFYKYIVYDKNILLKHIRYQSTIAHTIKVQEKIKETAARAVLGGGKKRIEAQHKRVCYCLLYILTWSLEKLIKNYKIITVTI